MQLGQTSRFVLVDCGIRTIVPFLRLVDLQISRQCSSVQMQWRCLVPLTRELLTITTQETTDALSSPRASSILPVPTTGNNANRGRNSCIRMPQHPSNYCYQRADWNLFTQLAVITEAMVTTTNISHAATQVTNTILNAADITIPKSSPHPHKACKP
ncbi:hypothetical protein AVEN_216348-1 [Araneus ventricosus]|uniref:Uncharacterized protein n=1 Tax=Araneus ventricosus TaxID=182803 RepID=A0A4Y2GXF8_ARAVE|nr:hypothetical protein AVEN_216348-1 [Araneus ventricosus]